MISLCLSQLKGECKWHLCINGIFRGSLMQQDQMCRNKCCCGKSSQSPKKWHKVKAEHSPIKHHPCNTSTSQIIQFQNHYSFCFCAVFAKQCSADMCLGDYNQLTVTQRCWVAQRIRRKDKRWMMFPVQQRGLWFENKNFVYHQVVYPTCGLFLWFRTATCKHKKCCFHFW